MSWFSAEHFNVSDRTVSRWETGTNLPDLSTLIEIADFYEVDIREIIDGERRSESMRENLKETLTKVADYTNTEKETKKRKLNRDLIIGTLCFTVFLLDSQFDLLRYIFVSNIAEFVSGALCGLGLCFQLIGLYNLNHDVSLQKRKMNLIK